MRAILPLLSVGAGLLLCTACGLPAGEHERYTVHSAHTGSSYDVRTFVPEGLEDPASAPQLVVLDGDWHAVPAFLEAGRPDHPPVVVVSVGYEGGNERMRDYTPTHVEPIEASGGLEAFVLALEEEILPDAPGAADDRIWFGHSAGGIAVTHLWLTRPDLGRHAIAASPAYYWDDGLLLALAEGAGPPGELVITVGEQEGWGMPAAARHMAQELGDAATLYTYPTREHMGTISPSLRDGLQRLLGGA